MKDMMSYGMLCSGEELCLDKEWYPGADVNGIMILDQDAPVGEDIRTYLGLEDYWAARRTTMEEPSRVSRSKACMGCPISTST